MADLAFIKNAAQAIVSDEGLRDQILDFGYKSRRAVAAPASKPKRVKRVGVALGQLGEVVTRAGAKAEATRRAQRRARMLRGGAVLAAVGAAAAAVLSRRSPTTAPSTGGPNV